MSDLSTENLSLSNLGADAGVSSLNTADIPENIRDGNSSAREAYVEGLAFEDVLVKEFAQQMVQSSSSSDGLDGTDGSNGSDEGSSSSGGLFGASNSSFASMIPDTLASAIMSNGGLGIADEIAQSIDPDLHRSSSAGQSSGGTSTTTTTSTTPATGGTGLASNTEAAS